MIRGSIARGGRLRPFGLATGVALALATVLVLATPASAGPGGAAGILDRQTTEPSGPGGIGERPGGGRITTEPKDPEAPGGTGTTTTPQVTTTTEADDDPDLGLARVETDEGTSAVALAAAGFVGLVLGVLLAAVPLGLALARRRRPGPVAPGHLSGPGAVPGAGPAPAPPGPAGPVIGPAPSRQEAAARSQRAALAEALMGLRDQLPSTALADDAARSLAEVGIHEIRPDGQPFDPARHRAVDQVETSDPARHNTVASTERPGYVDGDRVVRLPEVVVARLGEGA